MAEEILKRLEGSMEIKYAEYKGVKFINTTPHPLNMVDIETGAEIIVPTNEFKINAKAVEEKVCEKNGITFVATKFEKEEESEKILEKIKKEYPDSVIIGSIIAAQAYPGRIAAMIAAPGYERVAPNEKKMRIDKFMIYT